MNPNDCACNHPRQRHRQLHATSLACGIVFYQAKAMTNLSTMGLGHDILRRWSSKKSFLI
jgi:hypothetical protein